MRRAVIPFGAVAILIAVGAIGRFYHFTSSAFGPDEDWSAYLATGHGDVVIQAPHDVKLPPFRVDFADPATSWSNVMTGLTGVTHPPLYYLALRAWARAVGESDFRLRLFSGLCSLLCIPAMYGVVRQRNGVIASLLSAAFMAFVWSQVEFAQQARPYAMLVLLCLSCAGAVQAIESAPGWSNALWLFVSILAVCLTHYFAAGVVAAVGIYALIIKGKSRRWASLSVLSGVAVAAAIWTPFFLRSLAPCKQLYSEYGQSDVTPLWNNLLLAPSRILLHDPSMFLAIAIAIVLILAMVAAGRSSLLWSIWLVLSLGFVSACDIAHHSELLASLRYSMVALPAVIALVVATGKLLPKSAYVLLMLFLLLGVACDGVNRSLGQSESAMLIWYKATPPRTEGNLLVFRSGFPGSQPLDYIAYRRLHPTLDELILFTDK